MRKIIILIAIIFIGNQLLALEIKDRIIAVTGNAEMLVLPDEIELEITLKEQSGGNYLSKIEEKLWGKLAVQDITQNELSHEHVNVLYYWYYWWKNRKAAKKTRKIVLKLSSKTNFLKLMKALNNDWVTDIKIISVSNRRVEQYKKEIQIKAMKAAKDKATYLLGSINEEVGNVVSVKEIKGQKSINNTLHIESGKYSGEIYSKIGGGFSENIPAIRLSYAVQSKFEIK